MKRKGKTIYHVIRPDGVVANSYDHTVKREAEIHKSMLEAFWR